MAESAGIGFQSYRAPAPDPRYQNADFRTSQAKRYLGFFQGNVVLTCEEHDLIPRLCYSEIRQEQAWNALTRVEQCMFKISDSFFSRIPNDTATVIRIFGASVITIGALMVSAYTSNDTIVGLSLVGFAAMLYREMHLKNI